MFYYYCKKNLTELTVRFSRGLYMILEFEKIGRIDVDNLIYQEDCGEYLFSDADKRKVERIMMEELVSATLVCVYEEWDLVVCRAECSPLVDDFFVFRLLSDGQPYISYTY